MPIDYKHLKSGTAVTSESVNSRFDGAMGSAEGVNKITTEDLIPGALRGSHIPSLVGPAGRTASSMDTLFTSNTYNKFGSLDFSVKEPRFGPLSPIELTYPTGSEFKLSAEEYYIHALVVLVNLNIEKFSDIINEVDLQTANTLEIRVHVQVEDVNGVTVGILKSSRALAPRITMNEGVAIPLYGDHSTHQDIAIRTVILEEDISNLDKIKTIRIVGQLQPGLSGFEHVSYGKGNMTVIPIHAKVL